MQIQLIKYNEVYSYLNDSHIFHFFQYKYKNKFIYLYFYFLKILYSNPVDVLRLMAMALNGNHVNDPQIIYTKTKNLKVELLGESKDKDPIPVNLDGEIGGHLPIDFENLKQHIEFYVG